MRVGIVTTWFERGAAYVTLQYARKLEAANIEVFIYARGGYDENFNNDYPIEIDEGHNLIVRSALNIKQYENWLKSSQISHVLFNEQFWWQPVILTKKMEIKCLAYIDYYTKDTVPIFAIYDKLFCNTRRHYSAFEDLDNAIYLPWGTDVELYSPRDRNINSDEVVFFHSVGWSPMRKGTDLLLKAASMIDKDFKLILHSQIDLLNALPECKGLIIKLLDSGRLELINKTVEAPGLYYLGDVYVYPSRLEGIGLSIAEALSCGLPAIVPDNGPMNEFIHNSTCKTIIVKEFEVRDDNYFWPMCIIDIEDLALKMEYFIDKKVCLNELSRITRKHAEKNLNWEINAKILVDQFKSTEYKMLNDTVLEHAKMSDVCIMKYGFIYSFSPKVYSFLVKLYKKVVSR